MKLKQFIFAFVAVLLCSVSSVFAQNVAKIGETEYATLQDAIDAAEPGAEVTLLMDITLGTYGQGKSDAAITINKAITLDGDGKTFTSKAGRAINIDVAGEVVIKNLTIKQYCGRNSSDQKRCINVINQTATVKVTGCTLEMVEHTYSGKSLTSYVAGVHAATGANHNITIDSCVIKTIYGVVVYAAGSKIDIKDSDISNALYAAWINAACDIDVVNSTITTKENMGTNNLGVAFLVQASDVSVTADENTTINVPAPKGDDGTATGGQGYAVYSTSKAAELDIDLSDATVNKVKADDPVIYLAKAEAKIYREDGTVMFDTLDDAIAGLTANDKFDQLKSLTGEEVSVDYVNEKLKELGKDFYYTENGEAASSKPAIDGSGTWGGIDWTLYEDGELVIAPTAGEPVPDKNAPTKRTYEVGEWREAVKYNSKGEGVDVAGWPYDRSKVTKLTIEEGVTSIGSFTAQGFTNLTGEVVIPASVTYIGQEAFMKSTMTKLTFAKGGTEELCIAQGAFKNLVIEEVELPADRPVHLHAWVFGNCKKLKHATLPATVNRVWGSNHIDYLTNFEAQSNPTWGNSSLIFTACDSLETITFGSENVRDIFFAEKRNAVTSYSKGVYNGDYIQAYIGLTAYNTLEAALEAAEGGQTITVLKDINDKFTATAPIVVNKAVTIKGNGKTFTSNAKDCAFKVTAQGAKIENLKISAPNAVVDILTEGATLVKLADSYYPTVAAAIADAEENAELTLLAGTYSEDININKNITLKGVMNEAAPVALDDTESQNSGMTVYTGTMTIGEADVTIQNIDFVGKLVLANGATVKAAEGLTVTTNVEGYEVAYENGTYSVVEKKNDVAKIGETGYASLAAAFAAANVDGNHTITLLADNAEVFEFAQVAGANITVDGDDKTFTGKITLNAGAGNLTFTDMTLTPSNADAKSIVLSADTAPDVTIDGCTMKNTGTKGAIVWGQASYTNNKVVIKNSTASNLQYLVGTNQSGCEDVTVENVTATNMAYLIRPMKAKTVTVKDVKYSGLTFIHVKNSKESVLALENVEVTTNGYLPIAMMAPDSGTDAAMYTITLNGENTANGAAMTKANEAAWFEREDESNPYEIINLNAEPVAKIGEQDYESLAEALAAAKAGDTITFLADITEDVTVDKALTIDGAKYTYTGAMTLKADATIKNLNFDGNGYNGYAITTRGAQYLTIEDCTAKNYGYGFVQLASATDITTVKNVTVSNMSFGVKVDYSNAVVLENVDITASSAAVLNSNYGEKTITIKNSKLNILGTWDRETAIKTNYVFEGANTVGEFKTEAAIDNFKLAAGATLTAPNDIDVTTDVEGYEVAYENGAYSVVEQKNYVAKIRETGYETFVDAYVAAKGGDTIELLADVTVPTVKDLNINSNYGYAIFEIAKAITIDGKGYTMTADVTTTVKMHTLHICKDGVVLKNVVIDNVGKTKNVNVYCAQNVVFDNVQIINAKSGSAALTVNNSTVTTKTALTISGTVTAIDIDYGQNLSEKLPLGLNVEEGTVFDLNNKTVKFISAADVSTAGNAVDKNGNPYFVAKDNAYLYTVAQMESRLTGYSNGLTFIADAELNKTLKVKGTLDLNGHNVTIAEDYSLTASGKLTIKGNGLFDVKKFDNSSYIAIVGGTYTIDDVTDYCAEGYAALQNLDGNYVVGTKPTAQVNDLGELLVPESDYIVYGGSKNGDMPLSFVMQFLANQTADDMKTSPYADWFADFVITFEGLSEEGFTADGCYLAGYYGEFGWVKVPVDGMTVKNGERYPVMLGVGMGQKYDYICSDVKDFRCAMFLTPEVLAANPNISVKLELAVVDNSKASEGALEALVNNEKIYVVGEYTYTADDFMTPVAQIAETQKKYASLTEALADATAGQTITFLADIAEDVTLTKSVTIKGAEFAYTGKMTLKADATIKNVNFDGKGYDGYAVETRGANYVTIEGCTAKNYGYGFVQNASSTVLTTVKNVTVSDMRYGVKVDYATAVVLENVDITATSAAVLNSNYGEKTITIKNSKLNILATWKRNGTTMTTYVFEGENTVGEFMTEAGLDNFKLAAGATLTAPEGLTVTTDVEHYIVDYTDGIYRAIPDPSYIAELTLVDGEFTDYAPYAGLTVGEFTYQRKFSTTWAPFYVPFNVPVSQLAEQGLEIAYINGVRRDDTNYDGELDDFVMEVIYIHGGSANGSNKTLKANYPYFVRTKSETVSATIKLEGVTLLNEGEKSYNCTTFTEEFFIKGVNMTRNLNDFASNDYVVTKDDETGEATWSNTNLRGSLRPFRFYMTVTSRENGSPVVINRSMAIAVRGEELPDGTTLIYDVEVEAAEDMIFDLQGRRVLETEKGRIYIKGGKKFIAQ